MSASTPAPSATESASRAGERLAIDAANRVHAIDPGRSFIIEAPAGAGKTELLTQRFLALLAQVNDPEEIIALTFTNKAAAEMRHRVVSSLQLSARGVEPPEPHRQETYRLGRAVLARDHQLQWGLMAHAARLQITTLDALCSKLARQMPLLSRLGSQPGIATDAQPYYAQAAQDTLEVLEDGLAVSDSMARVLDFFDNDAARFQNLVIGMLASRDQWLRHSRTGIDQAAAEQALADLIEDELEVIADLLSASLQSELMPVAAFAASQVLVAAASGQASGEFANLPRLESWSQVLQARIEHLPLWRGLAELLLTKGGEIRKLLPKELGFATPEGQAPGKTFKALLDQLRDLGCAQALARIRKLPDHRYDEAELRFIEDLVAVLKVASAKLWLAFKQERVVDFTEMAQNALLALGAEQEPTDLQLQLDYRISHLLVDEFQDTSPTQVELLKKLTAGWQAGDGRTLFVVGDPMQSIYKFRKADVGLFIKVRENGLGSLKLEPLRLYRNNRSAAQVVAWVNANFVQVFAAQDNHHRGSVKFVPAEPTRGDHALARVQFHALIDASQNESEDDAPAQTPADQLEARQVIAIIRQAQAEDPQGSIAVLVKARTHLQALVSALGHEPQRIAFQAVEIEALAQRQVIQDLLSLTHALHHQADRTQWLAILRAPWCGLLLQDVHVLAAQDHASTLWALMHEPQRVQQMSADGQQRLSHIRRVLAEAFEHQGRQRPRRWVEGAWQGLGGPLCLSGPRDLNDAQAFFQVLDAVTDQGFLDLNRLDEEVAKLYAAPDPNASPLVQIMTIHKSKGLEFDTVILPGLHRSAPNPDKPLLVWDEVSDATGNERLVVAAMRSGKAAPTGGAAKVDLLNGFEAERTLNELQRLLYVAVTRARRQVHLLGTTKPAGQDEQDAVRLPPKDSLLALIWHVAAPYFDQQALALASREPTPPASRTPVDAALFTHRLIRLQQPAWPQALQVSDAEVSAAVTPVTDDETFGQSEPAADRLAADIGTLVHRYLEWVAQDGLAQWDAQRIDSLNSVMRIWLQNQGNDLAQSERAAATVQQQLRTTLACESGRWLLASHPDAGSEVPLSSVHDGIVRSHVVDRTFVDQGVRWIIDYKTTQTPIAPGPSGERQAVQAYREQLLRYQRLYVGREPVRLGVFFTHHGRLLTVED